MKRVLSLLLSAVMLLSVLFSCGTVSYAATYRQQLKNKGFTESYLDSLVELHQKYPNWEFEPFNTGLDWSAAVAGERSYHSKQIIEKTSSYSDIYYCNCSSCKKNGSYVYHYGSCVSASEWAVKYFMDPRNWLSEKYIFQFEGHNYDASQVKSGVEAILKPTWMYKSYISYVNTSGKTVYYTNSSGNKVTYSAAIMYAAKKSGASPYYLASRIVKEVGSSKPTATGVCGTKSPFIGMYNYYSIGAGGGAMAGLEYASGFLRTEKSTTLYASYNSQKKVPFGAKTTLSAGQYMSYIKTCGKYYKVRLYGSGYSTGKTGFVLKSALRTTYFNYHRPWTNPFKAIFGGAQFISASYLKHQYTSYLEKFNVNSASGSLYDHEYMQNVNAPSIESVSTYQAYQTAGLLSKKHVFYIPVFKNMPGETGSTGGTSSGSSTTSSVPSGLKLTSRTVYSISLKWTGVKNASQYYLYIKNNTKSTKFSKYVNTASATISNLTPGNSYSIWVCAKVGDKWTGYSEELKAKAIPMKTAITSIYSSGSGELYAKWNTISGATGYRIEYSRNSSFTNIVGSRDVTGNSHTGHNFTKGVTYYVRVRAYTVVDGKRYYGLYSATKTVVSK